MHSGSVAIFSSCAGYGTYTPALVLQRELSARGVPAKLFVYETFLSEEQQSRFLAYRGRFHENFRFAQMASGIASGALHEATPPFSFPEQLISGNFTRYVVLYGLWVPALLALGIPAQQIICVQMDAAESPSWRAVHEWRGGCENIWMLGMGAMPPVYKFRDGPSAGGQALVIHCGGWGVPHYAAVLSRIPRSYELHVIHSSPQECGDGDPSYYTPIRWMPDPEHPEAPPLYRYPDHAPVCLDALCRSSAAIISKPGGGTCADCLRLHIPLVYLQGMARHEEENARHFRALGYACSFEEWEESGFSPDRLRKMSRKIAADMSDVPEISLHVIQEGTYAAESAPIRALPPR